MIYCAPNTVCIFLKIIRYNIFFNVYTDTDDQGRDMGQLSISRVTHMIQAKIHLCLQQKQC